MAHLQSEGDPVADTVLQCRDVSDTYRKGDNEFPYEMGHGIESE